MLREPRFVDREPELAKMMRWVEEGRYIPIYLYGPEGCGKTRLLKEFCRMLLRMEGCIVIYIDALEERSLERALIGDRNLMSVARDIVEHTGGPVGKVLVDFIEPLIERLYEKIRFKGKRVVLLIDDVAMPLGVGRIELYAKRLLSLSEELIWRMKAHSALVIATTSEGKSAQLIARHTYANLYFIWNLPKESFTELARQLNAPDEQTIERSWLLTGGNPRALIEIASIGWSINQWMKHIEHRIRRALLELGEYKEALQAALENPDTLTENKEALDKLLSLHLVIDFYAEPLGRKPQASPELGIGEEIAWQMPAYMQVIKKLLR